MARESRTREGIMHSEREQALIPTLAAMNILPQQDVITKICPDTFKCRNFGR